MNTYVHPEYLVETDWVAEHLDDPDVRTPFEQVGGE